MVLVQWILLVQVNCRAHIELGHRLEQHWHLVVKGMKIDLSSLLFLPVLTAIVLEGEYLEHACDKPDKIQTIFNSNCILMIEKNISKSEIFISPPTYTNMLVNFYLTQVCTANNYDNTARTNAYSVLFHTGMRLVRHSKFFLSVIRFTYTILLISKSTVNT